MKGMTHINLIRKGNNVYVFHNSSIVKVGTLGRQGELVRKLNNVISNGEIFSGAGPSPQLFMKSRLKSKRVIREGYLPLPRSDLKKIYNSYKKRVSHWTFLG